jgi:hypothetical protein
VIDSRNVHEYFDAVLSVPVAALIMDTGDAMAVKTTHYLVDPWLPRGMMTLLAGYGEMGKSQILTSVAAALSTGRPVFGLPTRLPPGDVWWITYEEDAERTVLPRFLAAGGDRRRLVVIRGVALNGTTRAFKAQDLPALEAAFERAAAEGRLPLLLGVDPVISFLNDGTDTNASKQVRAGLEPLGALCARFGVTVVGLAHLNKGHKVGRAIEKVSGSESLTNFTRAVWMATEHPDDPDLRVLACVKHNYKPKPPALAYGIEGVRLDELDVDGYPVDTSRVVWKGAVEYTADELAAAAAGAQASKTAAAARWLRQTLREAGGSLPREEVCARGDEAGFDVRTLQRAATAARLRIDRHGYPAKSVWVLPAP